MRKSGVIKGLDLRAWNKTRNERTSSAVKPFLIKKYNKVYAALAVISAYVALDSLLPVREYTSTISAVQENRVNISSGRWSPSRTRFTYWSSVELANGIHFKYQGGASGFPIGDTVVVLATPVRKAVLRFKVSSALSLGWSETDNTIEDYKPFPWLVCVTSLLLLIPILTEQWRAILHLALIVSLFPWLLIMIGSGIL
jgi:hypothetical protein